MSSVKYPMKINVMELAPENGFPGIKFSLLIIMQNIFLPITSPEINCPQKVKEHFLEIGMTTDK